MTEIRMGAILRAVNFLEDHYPDLAASRFPGTDRPWREPQMTPERRLELADLARSEAEVMHSDLPPHLRSLAPEELGESPAPGHVDVMDLLVEILAVADETAEHVAQVAGVDRLPTPMSAFADPRPYLRFIAQNAYQAVEADLGMAAVIVGNLTPLVRDTRRSLSLLMDGQTLKAECPFCRGITPYTPAGGALTLKVRVIPDPGADGEELPVVMCDNDTCTPEDADCNLFHRGRPAWGPWDWTWLAERLENAAA